MKTPIEKNDFQTLYDDIEESVDHSGGSEENNETAQTWVPWFRNKLKCRVKFDTKTAKASNRPDLQIWASKKDQDSSAYAPLWLEAKPFDSLKANAKRKAAINEAFEKVKEDLQSRSRPPALIVSDLERVYYWSPDRIIQILQERQTKPSDTTSPTGTLLLSDNSDREILSFLTFLRASLEDTSGTPTDINLDAFVADLLAVTRVFQKDVLPKVYAHVSETKRTEGIFDAWRAHGGSTTIALVRKDDVNSDLGDEETFAELCFHTLVVRLFAVKWCLDHGYLDDTKLKESWERLESSPKEAQLDKVLRPKGQTEIEMLLAKVFGPTDMYMWINGTISDEIRSALFRTFQKQRMITADTDILGEFYQRYLGVYSKRSQFELGQFYTPHNLVRAMWKLTADALSERGLSLDDDTTIVVDPAAGTGTFMTQGLRYSITGNWGDSRRKMRGPGLAKYVRKFSGLELNPFSKGVADINYLTEVLAHCSHLKSADIPIPSIFETNSYEINPVEPERNFEDDADVKQWIERWNLSSRAKKTTKYRIVIGNPPWRNPSPVNDNPSLKRIVDTEIVPWAHEYQEQRLSSIRGCNHGIREDYIFFMGVANKLVQSDGLICYVTSESWLDSPTYTLVRKYLLDNYNIKRIIRIGPYFKGVAQPASVVVMERDDSLGREQKISFLDWSDINNSDYSYDWINKNLARIVSGTVRKSEWKTIVARDENCVLLPSTFDSRGLDQHLIPLDKLFETIIQGAQPGFTPLFVDKNKTEVIRKARLLFSGNEGNHQRLAKELGPSTRGGAKKAKELIRRAYRQIKTCRASFENAAIREIYAHFAEEDESEIAKVGYCYFDSRIWHRSRVKVRVAPGVKTLWDSPLKLVFRDFSDTGKKKKIITAFVDDSKRIADNHCINGGSQIVTFDDDLHCIKKPFRSSIDLNAQQWCYYVYALFNSEYAEDWAKENTKQRIKVPVSPLFVNQMREIARLGQKHRAVIEKAKENTLSELEKKRLDQFRDGVSHQIQEMSSQAAMGAVRQASHLEDQHKAVLVKIAKAKAKAKSKKKVAVKRQRNAKKSNG